MHPGWGPALAELKPASVKRFAEVGKGAYRNKQRHSSGHKTANSETILTIPRTAKRGVLTRRGELCRIKLNFSFIPQLLDSNDQLEKWKRTLSGSAVKRVLALVPKLLY